LAFLKQLGITAVEVMPINEFPGDFSWGYNPADTFAAESAYGGPDAFKSFVKTAINSVSQCSSTWSTTTGAATAPAMATEICTIARGSSMARPPAVSADLFLSGFLPGFCADVGTEAQFRHGAGLPVHQGQYHHVDE